jgi:transposase
MWTSRNRGRYDRSKLRYPSDVTDEEWELIVPLIPPGKSGGGKRTVIMREVVNGLMYVLSTGCQWRAIPTDLPPKSTVYDYFDLWTYDGTLQRIHHALYEQCREQAQREASPTAAIIDSQSVKSAEKGGSASMRRVTTPARKSRARSDMFSSIHQACCFTLLSILPTSKIEMEPFSSWRPCSECFPFFKSCSPTVAIRGRNSPPRWPKFARI